MFKGAEVLVQEEDTQNIEEPLVKPLRKQTFSVLEKETPETIVTSTSSESYIVLHRVPGGTDGQSEPHSQRGCGRQHLPR